MTFDVDYDVPTAATEVLERLLDDERLGIPSEVKEAAKNVKYVGNKLPYLCVPFKFTEAMAAIKGLEAAFALTIVQARFDIPASTVTIDTDHASLCCFSAFTTTVNGTPALAMAPMATNSETIRDTDIHDSFKHKYRQMATNIYKTKDGRYFHLHGSLDGKPSMRMVGLDTERVDLTDADEIRDVYGEAVGKIEASELDRLASEEYKQAGTICYTHDEFRQLEAGKAIANSPVYELSQAAPTAPVAWPEPTARMALSGIKVLELTRIIAGPAIGKGLAEHGATVLRLTSKTLPDLWILHPDLNQGKAVADVNLKTPEGKATLARLIKDADVVIDGYRPGALEKLGFGRAAIRKLNPNIVHVRENCYGWHGPWAGRSGWQQISDCFVGLSWGFGQKMGLDEPVVPIFPNSDYGAGAAGVVGVMHALLLRATKGGAYDIDLSLSYYNVLLMQLGYYPDAVWAVIRPSATLRYNMEMTTLLPLVIPELVARRPDVFKSPKFWHTMDAPSWPGTVRTVAPVVRIDGIETGVRRPPGQNGDDPAEWPEA